MIGAAVPLLSNSLHLANDSYNAILSSSSGVMINFHCIKYDTVYVLHASCCFFLELFGFPTAIFLHEYFMGEYICIIEEMHI